MMKFFGWFITVQVYWVSCHCPEKLYCRRHRSHLVAFWHAQRLFNKMHAENSIVSATLGVLGPHKIIPSPQPYPEMTSHAE